MNPDSSFDDESPETNLMFFKYTMRHIASLSGKTVEPLTFRLNSEWDKATKKEKELCIEQVNEACRAVCDVIAPKDRDKLLRSFQESRREVGFSSDLKALATAYQQAP